MDQGGLAQTSTVEILIPDILFECEAYWQAGYVSPSFVAIGYCVNGCKGNDGLGIMDSASCAADLRFGFRGWGETHAPLQEELR